MPNGQFRNTEIRYITDNFVNNEIRFNHFYYLIKPEYLELELNASQERIRTISQFNELIHKVSLDIIMGEQTIQSIPLRFMNQLHNFEIYDNKFYITIPFDMFLHEIKMCSLQYHHVILRLTNTDNLFSSCKTISTVSKLYGEYGRDMIMNPHEDHIQQLSSMEISSPIPRTEFSQRLNFNSSCKGLFIECRDVNEIIAIELKLNNNIRHSLSHFLIKRKCIKITEKLLYFPFNYGKSYLDRTYESFDGSIDFSRYINVNLKVVFHNPHSIICIYGLFSNVTRIMAGMIGIALTYNISNTYYEYNETGIYNESIQPSEITPIRLQTNTVLRNICYKPITDDNIVCNISYEDIALNEKYMSCLVCHKYYKEDVIRVWFRQRNSCPMCRSEWTDFTVYINGEESETDPINIAREEINEPLFDTLDY